MFGTQGALLLTVLAGAVVGQDGMCFGSLIDSTSELMSYSHCCGGDKFHPKR